MLPYLKILPGKTCPGTVLPTSDIDFVVYGCKDIAGLETALEESDTLRKIDIFDDDSIRNEFLLEVPHPCIN